MPTINVAKLFGKEEDTVSGGLDPAEETLQAAKQFTNRQKKNKNKETTENNWEDEGGAFFEDIEDEEYIPHFEEVLEEDVKKMKELLDLHVNEKVSITMPVGNFRHPLSKRFHELLEEIGNLHDQKQRDYGTPDDPFANVRGATEFGLPASMGAFIAMNDIMQRIKSFVRNGRLENEPLDNALRDMAVYSLIALVLWEEEQENNE